MAFKDIYNLFDILKSKGRYGDTELAHVTKDEARLLESRGGAGTINPETGLKEYHGSLLGLSGLPAGHPLHHNQIVQDIYEYGTGLVEDYTGYDTGQVDEFLGMEPEPSWYDIHYEGDGHDHPGTWNADGTYTPPPPSQTPVEPSETIKYEDYKQYINEESGLITDPDGLAEYLSGFEVMRAKGLRVFLVVCLILVLL